MRLVVGVGKEAGQVEEAKCPGEQQPESETGSKEGRGREEGKGRERKVRKGGQTF